jgi:tetratricopeptide (TPR) repeat protein
MLPRTAAVFLVLILAPAFSPALAPVFALALAPADPAPDESEQTARELFRKAEINFNLGKFADALSDYQAAYEAKPLAGFLFNIAQCYRHMGNYERARFFYRRYLTVEPKTPNRRLVTDLIAEVTRLMDSAPPRPPPAPPPPVPAPQPPPISVVPANPTPRAAPLVAVSGDRDVRSPPGRPVYQRWWFWTSLAVMAAGGAATALLLTREGSSHGTQPPIDCSGPVCR